MDAVHFDAIVDMFIVLLGLTISEARGLAIDVFDLLPHDDVPSLNREEFAKVLRFVARRIRGEAKDPIAFCQWCGEIDTEVCVYPLRACPSCHQNASLWTRVNHAIRDEVKCAVCFAPIPPMAFKGLNGQPEAAYGTCPMGHTVIEQLEALSDLVTVEKITEYLAANGRPDSKIPRCFAARNISNGVYGLRLAKEWVEAHYDDNGSGPPRQECLVCGNWADECACTPDWCDEHDCSSYECECAWPDSYDCTGCEHDENCHGDPKPGGNCVD